MSTLIAIGAAIAVFTGIGAGIGIGHATGKAVEKRWRQITGKAGVKGAFNKYGTCLDHYQPYCSLSSVETFPDQSGK